MVAGDVRLAVDRGMTLPATHGPAFVRVEGICFSLRRKPLSDAAHLPRFPVKNVEASGDTGSNIRREQLCNIDNVSEVLTPL
ncbi:hypothetical protein D3C81_2213630 [compost metagenome]